MVDLPHVRKYGHRNTTLELVYGCDFPVTIGDLVRCPPTELYDQWTVGVVIDLTGSGYRGPIKYVRRYRPDHDNH